MTVASAHTARIGRLASVLSLQAPILLAIVVPPALASLGSGEGRIALSLAPQIVILCAIIVLRRGKIFPKELRQIEALAAFALLFLLASALVVPPFIGLGMSLPDAVFEAVSGITSTGLSVAQNTESWPPAAHLLRGWIQWCGGFAIAFAGLAIFTGSPGASLALGQSSFTARDDLSSLRTQARQVLISYACLTGLALGACLLVIPNWWEAASIALAAVSTGGFTPRADSLSSYTPLAQGVVIAICVLAAVSLMFYVQVLRDGFREALGKTHVLATLGLMAAGTGVFVVVDIAATGSGAAELYRGALNFLSGFSTAGFSVGEVTSHVSLLPLLLVAMFLGGDIGSTAGGLKVGRFVLVVQMVRLGFMRVSVPPTAVTYLRDKGARVATDQVIGVISLLALYMTTGVVAWIIFLMSDAPPLPALFEVTSALSTVGLSQGLTGPDMALHLKLTLIVTMLLGRLEFIALIILLLPQTWMKRS